MRCWHLYELIIPIGLEPSAHVDAYLEQARQVYGEVLRRAEDALRERSAHYVKHEAVLPIEPLPNTDGLEVPGEVRLVAFSEQLPYHPTGWTYHGRFLASELASPFPQLA